MKKRILLAIMMIALSTLAFGVISASAATEGIYTYTFSNGQATITKCDYYASGEIIIPDTLGGYPVTTIGEEAFLARKNITSVVIPNSVVYINDYAFYNCTSLENITIGDNVTSIGDFAFYKTKLTSITIPSGVTYISHCAFKSCDSLTSINVSADNDNYCSVSGVLFDKNKTTIISYPTSKTDSEYIIPDGVTSISPYAFDNSDALTSIIIPDGVTSIGHYSFYDCDGITNITLPDGLISIGDCAFEGCDKLTSINIPDSVTSIGGWAFGDCALTSITIPGSVKSIGWRAFRYCGLTSVTIESGVTSIGNGAFEYCSKLTTVTIPKSVTSIGDSAFYGCSSLSSVYYNGNKSEWYDITFGTDNRPLTSASRTYFYYVTLLDKDGNQISQKMQNVGETIDISDVVPDGYDVFLYTDKELTTLYNIDTPINENITLYVICLKLNVIEFEGTPTADIGEKGITQGVSFATDKEAKYFSLTLKVPNSLEVKEIKSDIFEIEQDYETIDNDTHYYLFLIYNGDGNIPTYQTLNAFEVVFDVSENAVADEILPLEILDDAILVDDDGNSYEFTSIEKAEIKINPILAEEITIVGADEIDTPTQYTVSVLPANTTNKTVEWSVSDETIATITEDGLLTPVKKGIVTIKATAKDGSGVYAEQTVSVKVLGTVNSISTNVGLWDKEYSPNTTNYTIYVPKTTTTIKLTAKHDGAFKGDGLTLPSNVARTVTLSTISDETVLDLTYTCEGYDDNKYTITIIKFEGTKTEVSEDKKSFTITPINVENGKTVILALYNGEQFVEMQNAVYTGDAIPFTTTKTYTKAKVIVWDDLTNLKPVCEVEKVE